MDLGQGIEIIETTIAERLLNVVLFRDRRSALIDTGIVGVATNYILPAFERIGFRPQQLTWVFNTHAHSDHFGGNEEIWLASDKKALLCAHELDTPWIEHPIHYTEEFHRYHVDIGVIGEDVLNKIVRDSGKGIKVSTLLKGGECFDLGNDLQLEVLFLPSHTPGNIAVFEKKHKVFVVGETIAGSAQYDPQGNILSVPYYCDVEKYLATIRVFSQVDFKKVVCAHLPPMERQKALRFLRESVNFVLDFDSHIINLLKNSQEPLSTIDLWRRSDNMWGKYPAELCMYMLIETHLRSLTQRAVISGSLKNGFALANDSEDNLVAFAKDVLNSIPYK